jgi:hypothetical protein
MAVQDLGAINTLCELLLNVRKRILMRNVSAASRDKPVETTDLDDRGEIWGSIRTLLDWQRVSCNAKLNAYALRTRTKKSSNT